jgi:putative oxidoreductase
MTPRDRSFLDYAIIALSFAIGALFIYAGLSKIGDPLDFADNIFGFAILPAALINLLALGLPPFEIGCGVLMFFRRTRRVAALALVLVTLMFCGALVSALARGLTLDCGCFGTGAPSRARMWIELFLDIGLFGSALLIYSRAILRTVARRSADASHSPS